MSLRFIFTRFVLSAVGLIIVLACGDSSSPVGDPTGGWAEAWFGVEAKRLVNGELDPNRFGIELCIWAQGTAVEHNAPLFGEAMERACDAVRESLGDYGVRLGHIDELPDLDQESLANEIGSIVGRLSAELSCGECLDVETSTLVGDFTEAVEAVRRFLEHSVTVYEKSGPIRQALQNAEWEQYVPRYSGHGEWQVLLHYESAGLKRTKRFKVLNRPGFYTENREVVEAGYPWVVDCGAFWGPQERVTYVSNPYTSAMRKGLLASGEHCRWGR